MTSDIKLHECREAFEAWASAYYDRNGDGAAWPIAHDVRHAYEAATALTDAKYLPVIEKLVEEAVDVRLLNDAITLITKSLAGILTDTTFASPHIEDHRPRVPSWVMTHFRHDNKRRIQYVNDIKQWLDWIRNATEKARTGKALALAEPLLKRGGYDK